MKLNLRAPFCLHMYLFRFHLEHRKHEEKGRIMKKVRKGKGKGRKIKIKYDLNGFVLDYFPILFHLHMENREYENI